MSDKTHFKTLAAVLLATLACFSISSQAQFIKSISAASWNVTISNLRFQPQNSTVQIGDTVTWINNDPVVHTLWFTKANDSSTYLFSDPINPGASWSHLFPDILQLKYFDFDRLWVNGSLTILPFFDFSVANSGDITLNSGGVGSNRITLALLGGQARSIHLSCSGLPSGIQCFSFYPSSGIPPFDSLLTITFSNSTPAITDAHYMITVIGIGGGAIRSTQFTLFLLNGSVGGEIVPVDRLALFAPYMVFSLAVSVVLLAFFAFIQRTRRSSRWEEGKVVCRAGIS